jgi:tetratricopeptide (TPR) repeat protein
MSRFPRIWIAAAAGMVLLVSLLAGCGREAPEVSLQTGMTRLLEGDYRGAAGRLERAARLLPDNATAHANLGIACWKLGQNRRAAAAFRKAAELNTNDARPLEFLGQVLMDMKKWDDARAALDEAARRTPPHARLFTEMAVVQLRAGKTEQGQALLKQAVLMDPGYPAALYNMAAVARDESKNNDEATRYFQKYLKVAGDDPHANVARRALGLSEKKGQKSEVRGQRSEVRDQRSEAGIHGPDGIVNSNKTPRTDTRARPRKPGPVDPLLAEARNAIEKQAYDEALVMLNEAIKKDPANPDALWELARFYEEHLDYQDNAAQMYRKFKQLFPDDPRSGVKSSGAAPAVKKPAPAAPPKSGGILTDSGKAPSQADLEEAQEAFLEGLKYQKAQDWDQAIRSYKRALEHNRNFAEASYNLGLAYKDNGNRDMAKDALLYTVAIKPEMTRAGYMLAIVYMELKDNEKAIGQLERILKLEPDNARAHYLIGVAYRTELHFDKAKAHFERYIQLEPGEPPAREAREWLDSLNKRPEKR